MFCCSSTVAGVRRLAPTQRPSTPLLSALLLLVGVVGAVDALGPPPGSAGTIDWRYPDPVMSVPLPCNTNGTFRHPIFCNWYYRCYETTYFPGFYQRATFVCAPGTEFAEALELCVWRGSIDTDNNGFFCSYLDDAWPQGVAGPSSVEAGLAGGASNVETEDCKVLVSRCKNDFLCLPEFMPRVSYAVPVKVCDLAERACPSGFSPACGGGAIWDATNEVCMPTDYLCSESPLPTATTGRPNIECRFEISLGECNDFMACFNNDTSTPIPFRHCATATRTCALAGSPDQRLKTAGVCQYPNYDLFLENCEDRFDGEDIPSDCDPGIETSSSTRVDCAVMKTACDEYVSCETGEKFTGCSNYYHCSSTVFSAQFPCPLGEVSMISAAGKSSCLPIRPAAVPRLQGNNTCVFTGAESLLEDLAVSPPRFRQQGWSFVDDTLFPEGGYNRDERSATDHSTVAGIEGREISVPESAHGSLADSLLPTYHLDTVQRSSSNARKIASPSVPESLMNLADSLRSDKKDSKQFEVLPIPADDSEHTLIQIPSKYFESSPLAGVAAGMSVSTDASEDKYFEKNSTAKSDSVVQLDNPICKFVGERPLPQNFSEVLQCSEENICDQLGDPLVTMLGCSTFVQCLPDAQGRLELEYLSCSAGHFFVAEELRCRDHAHYGGVPCSKEQSYPAALTCSTEFEVLELPSLEFEMHCSSYAGCDGIYDEDQIGASLCSAFYQCLLEPVSNTLQPVMMNCRKPLLFSYQHLKCLPPNSPLLCP